MKYDCPRSTLFDNCHWRLFITPCPAISVAFRNWIAVHMMKPIKARLTFQTQKLEWSSSSHFGCNDLTYCSSRNMGWLKLEDEFHSFWHFQVNCVIVLNYLLIILFCTLFLIQYIFVTSAIYLQSSGAKISNLRPIAFAAELFQDAMNMYLDIRLKKKERNGLHFKYTYIINMMSIGSR